MTDALPAERPSPAPALEAAFQTILQRQMHDVPMLNRALEVEAVAFRPWSDHWLGVLITPWFMNLVLAPRIEARWPAIADGASRHHVFPAGVFEFIGGSAAGVGAYQACSLFSPMFDFADHAAAQATAVAALDALFDPAHRAQGSTAPPQAAPGSQPPAPRTLSKRELLFGLPPRADRGP